MSPVDNEVYETLEDWWDPTGWVAGLHAMNPARAGYFLDVLGRRCGLELRGLRVLELGCGGGLLTEELARAGLEVIGVDRAEGALRRAAAHAREGGLAPRYVRAAAERLPVRDGSLLAVVSADLLEHVEDVEAVVREGARVLAPGGAFLFDTINRTLLTAVVHIGVLQRWRKIVPPDTHDWRRFVRPRELEAALRSAGLEPVETRGLMPERPLRFAWHLIRHRRGRDRMPSFRIGGPTAGSYVGFARKPGRVTPSGRAPT